MQGYFILYLVLALTSVHASASPAFKDAFYSYAEIRRLEEQTALLTARTSIDPEKKARELQSLYAKLTEARIDFHAVLPSGQANLSPWEKRVLERISLKKPAPIANLDQEALDFLQKEFPQARKFSALQWQVVGELFGSPVQDTFLKTTFVLEQISSPAQAPEKKQNLVWITTPAFPILSKAEIEKQKSARALAAKSLRSHGYEVEEIAVNPFTNIEDQAEDLQKTLKRRLEKGSFLLLSSGNSSALVYRTLDLYPELMGQSELGGWLNLNGILYGEAPAQSGRKPASSGESAADRLDLEVKQEILRMRQERTERHVPLSAKFPVVNLVTLGGKFRPNKNLRESLIPEGRTFFLPEGNPFQEIEAAVETLQRGPASAASAALKSSTAPKSK